MAETEHVVSVTSEGRWWRGVCSCGWAGGLRGFREQAESAGRYHLSTLN